MEVADRVAVINEGRLEQVGTPADLYDHPANPFVLRFVGPATELDGRPVRPHDLVLEDGPVDGSQPATVERVTRLGFEVRVELTVTLADGAPAGVWVQLSRREAERLPLAPGRRLWVARADGRVSGSVGRLVDWPPPLVRPAG